MPGYKDWIDTVDIKIDYYSAFMKAWIAFNAWYNYSGEIAGKTIKSILILLLKHLIDSENIS